MKYRWIAAALLAVVALGLLVRFSPASPAVAWRIEMLQRKLSGNLLGVSWLEVAVRLAPGVLDVRRFIDPGPAHFARKIDYPLEQDDVWKLYKLYGNPTSCLEALDVHVSVLRGGEIPHALHSHRDEEFIIPVSGELEVLRAKDGDGTDQTVERIGPGSFVYHAADGYHTIRAVGPESSSYLVFKWGSTRTDTLGDEVLRSAAFDYSTATDQAESRSGSRRRLLFEGPTHHLAKLHAHASMVEPGAGYAPHSDDYDVGIFLYEGTIETVGERIEAPSVVYYSAHKPHGLRNPGEVPAKYLVFEFHGCTPRG